jgi:hypothetical protein
VLEDEESAHPAGGVVLQLSATADWQDREVKGVRPVIFKWRQFEPAMIVASVNWYPRYSLSPRDVEELPIERGVSADHAVAQQLRLVGTALRTDRMMRKLKCKAFVG